jgi:hypothetical protein
MLRQENGAPPPNLLQAQLIAMQESEREDNAKSKGGEKGGKKAGKRRESATKQGAGRRWSTLRVLSGIAKKTSKTVKRAPSLRFRSGQKAAAQTETTAEQNSDTEEEKADEQEAEGVGEEDNEDHDENGGVEMQRGFLWCKYKRGTTTGAARQSKPKWHYVYCVLRGSFLYLYDNEMQSSVGSEPKSILALKAASTDVIQHRSRQHCFVVTHEVLRDRLI